MAPIPIEHAAHENESDQQKRNDDKKPDGRRGGVPIHIAGGDVIAYIVARIE